ncbi:prepilin-type N-terminal cleavage/methylation domain-containing protein [Stenotrophomonas sp. MYb238]|uniref:type II secretion system protein n=1 Tax=Stenotrophomonas sp. MYb238 TaxID=2040281 RepID=UPI00129155CC|nr:type II secretion system protein [Stenotrophomonas sp. MYb238]MQP77353.1 prepilin-type N-terminal cleavage/methylation domain-containing protein [Stenotrophomonas sp. MYb238]
MSQHLRGYTLLEMVVVMAILAMATAIAAPPSYRMIRSWQEATQVEDVIQQLERLPSAVRASGNPLSADAESGIELIDLPQDWVLHMDTPLQVQANGACSDAQGTLITTYQTVEFRVLAPFCRIQRIDP